MQRTFFESSLKDPAPPENFSICLAALWWIRNNHWEKAHDLVDGAPGADAAWVHALLHRIEGDQWNANYWYARSGREVPSGTIQQEIDQQIAYFLN
ncbi:hypothetical protein [Lewinella sp. W8]|uniref:hypothetical protein n=1 Tax=Lewinella sp. W8 TaxID=2528208 RepID=UPI0010684EB2|nr:hypothetical protein [Lewinella sp. W8]MTB53151.1 hypothetical protein [Lewinella sp. W8]